MLGIGVGGSDAVDAMAGLPWELMQVPSIIVSFTTSSLTGVQVPQNCRRKTHWLSERLGVH